VSRRAALVLLAVGLCTGCRRNESATGGIEGAGVDVLSYPNGHPLATETSDPLQRSVEDQLFALANSYRFSQGLAPLVGVPAVQAVARAHGRHMRVHDFFDHVNPEGDGPAARLTRAGIAFGNSTEVLAAGQGDASEAFNAWLASPPHRAMLDSAEWTQVGAGYWSGGAFGTYYTMDFIRP